MGQDVFISYKSEEFQEADWVRQQLESGGISCWMAPNTASPAVPAMPRRSHRPSGAAGPHSDGGTDGEP